MIRRILGPIAGIAVAIVVVTLIEGAGHLIFPPPTGTDISDPEALAELIVAGGIYSMLTIPHPPWMIAASTILPLLAAGIAGRLRY